MQKYLPKNLLTEEYTKDQLKDIKKQAVTAKKVSKDTTIETMYGPALITAGNYILTDSNKNSYGMTPQDFEHQYGEWDS